MPLTILKDDEIAAMLNVLTVDELESFRTALKQALYEYSTGMQGLQEGDDIQQPPRTSVTSPVTGGTTLFMPSCNTHGIGMKGAWRAGRCLNRVSLLLSHPQR